MELKKSMNFEIKKKRFKFGDAVKIESAEVKAETPGADITSEKTISEKNYFREIKARQHSRYSNSNNTNLSAIQTN